MIFNAHVHLNTDDTPKNAGLYNATNESEWPFVLQIYNPQKQIIPAIGIHPWQVETVSKNWEEKMAELLDQYPFLQVGEIGLDTLKPNLQKQEDIFIKQLLLAKKFNRITSIHSVHSSERIFQLICKVDIPCPFILHNYHEKAVMAEKFAQRGAFFSIGKNFSVPQLRNIPLNRILLETDMADSSLLEEKALSVADILGISAKQFKRQLTLNIKDLLNVGKSF